MIEHGSRLAEVYERATDADKVALVEASEAHEIAYASAVRATRWHDVVRTPAARRAALAAHRVADETFKSLENAMLLADARINEPHRRRAIGYTKGA
jgi:hypothetical protein